MAGGWGDAARCGPGDRPQVTPSAASCLGETLRRLLRSRLCWVSLPAPRLHLPPPAPPLTLPRMMLVPLRVLSVSQRQGYSG